MYRSAGNEVPISYYVILNMCLARSEGAGLSVVQALGAIAPQAGCKKA
ncbi:MAG: hypothetical protein IT508_06900 [Burkholderiaceae bacterium]|nr:hypothetical protein [Burkholderiaceae bacterium]